jgi:hypothetical protein
VERRVDRRLPSPALLVALLALFMALSATTWAVTKVPKRSVGSRELAKGAVREENIARGAVTAAKLHARLGAATAGARGTAPSLRFDASFATRAGHAENAGHADSAALADDATLADTATTSSSAGTVDTARSVPEADRLDGHDSSFFLAKSAIAEIPRFSLGGDETRTMLAFGPFTLTARCYINNIAMDDADVLISTTQPHSAFHAFSSDPDLNPGDPEAGRSLIGVDGPTGLPQIESLARGAVVAPDGSEIRSLVLYVGLNLFGEPGRCTFGGVAIL